MKNTRLLKILKSLSPEELNELGDFIYSPYFNKSKKLMKLYDFLKKLYPAFDANEVNKHTIYALMYPGDKYNDKKLRDRLSLMVKLVEKYLSYHEFRGQIFENKLNLAKQLQKKNIESVFEYGMEDLMHFIEGEKEKNEDYYLKKYFAEKLSRENYESKTQAGKMKLVYDSLLMENDNLFIFCLITFMINYIKLLDTEGLVKLPQNKMYKRLLDYIGILYHSFENIPAVQILYKLIMLYFKENDDIREYREVRLLLDKNSGVFKKEDKIVLYTMLYDCCKDMQSKGKKQFGRESFEIMTGMIKKDLVLENDGSLHPHNFINCAATAIRVNQIQWAEEFVAEYKNKVKPEFRENAFNYNSASLLYIKARRNSADKYENFRAALCYLSRVKKQDFYYYARIKNMEIKIYYELNELNRCLDTIESYKKSFDKNELIPEHLKTRYCNFVRFAGHLISLRDKFDNYAKHQKCEEREKLKQEISECNEVEYKQWLREKVEKIN